MTGGVSTSMGSGSMLVGDAVGFRPVKRGMSSDEPSSTTAALPPIVVRRVGPVRFLPGIERGAAFIGGANVCELKVCAHSSCENFVPPGDAVGVGSVGCAKDGISPGTFRALTGDLPLERLAD